MIRRVAAVALVAAGLSAAAAAEGSREAFTSTWAGRTVLVKQTLYTLTYDERGLMGQTRRDKREGLTVVTPFNGSYFQFDGRQKQDDVLDQDPQRLVEKINTTYQADSLAVRSYQKIQPHLLHRYVPGAELVISKARIERDFVRLVLVDRKSDFGEEPATTLTVRWPSPFSRSFGERDVVEGLVQQYLQVKSAR